MGTQKYLDEQLAKARRIYLEEQIEQREDKGIWKGEIYTMKELLLPDQRFHMHLPDLFHEKELETAASEEQAFAPFLVMLSRDKDIFCSFYHTNNSKTYEPDAIHEMFESLYPDHELSELGTLQNHTVEVFNFHYISKDESGRYYHTVFIFDSDTGQVIGHFSGALTEVRKLKQMEQKILKTIKTEGAVQ